MATPKTVLWAIKKVLGAVQTKFAQVIFFILVDRVMKSVFLPFSWPIVGIRENFDTLSNCPVH